LNIEKRVLLAVFLIAVVLVLSNMFMAPPTRDVGPREESAIEQPTAPTAEKEYVDVLRQEVAIPVAPKEDEITPEATVWVDTDLYRLGISSTGGRLISMELKEYASYLGNGGVQLIPAQDVGFMGLRVIVEKDTLHLDRLSLVPSTTRVDASQSEKRLVFSHPVGDQDSLSLVYRFSPGEYVIDATLQLPGAVTDRDITLQVDLLPRLMPTEVDSVKNDINYFGTVMGSLLGDVEKVDIGDLDEGDDNSVYKEGPFLWAGVKNKYFVAALVSKEVPMKGVISRGAESQRRIGLTATLPPGEGGRVFAMELYLGPQDYYRLSALGVGMEDIVQYGWWIIRPFTRMILVILLWMHQFISNYGVVIILFSVITKIAFYPLTQKSLRASQDLQKVQPLLKELKEKYKKDPQKLQQETMRLYKEQKVNPLGGCLPLLVQMPVLWALFYVFRMTIEFRGAGFTLWIQDLSAPDSPPVLPVVMGLSMFLQQKLSPQSADPKMAPMMYVMPVVLTIIFINFPAGLVLYWTVNNILAIAQQYFLMKKGTQPPAVKKPSKQPA
jgi:YidC/Oxa1 family membrane protein insertase